MRSRLLLAGLLAAAALPAGAQAAAPNLYASYDFLGDRSASFALTGPVRTIGVVGTPTFAEADVAGTVRTVGRTAAGSGFVVSGSATNLSSAYTVAMAIDIADEGTEQRLLTLRGASSPVGLWIKDGRLEYRAASGTVRASRDFPADVGQLVFTRGADHVVSVYVDGELHLSLTDAAADGQVASIRVGNADTAGQGALDIARLRIGKGAMTAAEVAALPSWDADGPAVTDADRPEVVEGTRYAGPGSSLDLLVTDDGEGEGIPYAAHVETAAGTPVAGTEVAGATEWPTFGTPSAFGAAHSGLYRDHIGGTLVHGAAYDVVVTATDRFGHARTSRLPFVADTEAPRVGVDTIPARVTSHAPVFAGTAGTAANDAREVELLVCVASGCANERRGTAGGEAIAWSSAPVVDGRWQSEPVQPRDEDTGEPLPLPDGSYTLEVVQWDSAGNRTVLDRPFTVGPPLPVDEQRQDPPAGGGAPAPAPGGPAPAPAPAPAPVPAPRAASTQPTLDQFAAQVVSGLRAKGLKGLAKGVAAPAGVQVRVLDAAKRRTLASGARTVKLTAAGRRAVRGKRRLAVVVRVSAGAARVDRAVTLKR